MTEVNNKPMPDLKKAFGDALSKIGDFGLQETAFNEVIGQSKFLPVGEHKCTIQSAELTVGLYGPQIMIVWQDVNGASITQYVGLFNEDEKTKETRYARSYLSLLQCLANDMDFKLKYVKEIPNQGLAGKTVLVDGLTGCKADIVVVKGKKGYELVEENNQYFVKDVATGILIIETPFDSMGDAAKMAKAEGYNRAFNRVQFLKPDKEEVTANEVALRAAYTKAGLA